MNTTSEFSPGDNGEIHGFPVIAAFACPVRKGVNPGRVILVDRGREYGERFVVTWQGDGVEYWSGGDYYGNLDDAIRAWLRQVSRDVPEMVEVARYAGSV